MNDIRHYTDAELSLTIMNDEPLYKEVRRLKRIRGYDAHRMIEEYVSNFFIFTSEQLGDLLQTIDDDFDEDEKYLAEQGN